VKIVAVTSCLTGIAHTYMAAEALELAATALGHHITVETQGAAGSTPMPQAAINAADFCFFANDLEVKNLSRFAGKPFVHVNVGDVLIDAQATLAAAVRDFENSTLSVVPNVPSTSGEKVSDSPSRTKGEGFFKKIFG
jgi:PTS system fructose-specific IIC component